MILQKKLKNNRNYAIIKKIKLEEIMEKRDLYDEN